MLTADLVPAYRRAGELRLSPLDDDARARARALGAAYLDVAAAHVGRCRDELEAAWDELPVAARDRRVGDGLRKLALDRCTFEEAAGPEPALLRRDLFRRASRARAAGTFDRAALVAGVAAEHGLAPDALERTLWADLRGAQLLAGVARTDRLLEDWEDARAQAVLLRAVRVTADVRCADAAGYRALFRRLKFLRLLFEIQAIERGYRVVIDGPFSLFEAVTAYGLKLAMVVPALRSCDAFSLEAEVRWGKRREPLVFRLRGGAGQAQEEPRLPEELEQLARALGDLDTPWRAVPSPAILELPGVGLCVPDLQLEHAQTGEVVYLELLGYWSRDAVLRRVELAERGLPFRVLFAVSERLRVSEALLGEDVPSALYVFKGVLSARAVLERVERISTARGRRR